MLPKGSINQILEKHDFSTPQPLASRIQDLVVEFFNNRAA